VGGYATPSGPAVVPYSVNVGAGALFAYTDAIVAPACSPVRDLGHQGGRSRLQRLEQRAIKTRDEVLLPLGIEPSQKFPATSLR
jgi:hypothetical protein